MPYPECLKGGEPKHTTTKLEEEKCTSKTQETTIEERESKFFYAQCIESYKLDKQFSKFANAFKKLYMNLFADAFK